MIDCDKCRCTGRVSRVKEEEGEQVAVYVCANPRCGNYRQEFGQEVLPKEEKETAR